jgi:hypothetical protein
LTFVVVEQAPRNKHHFLRACPQTRAVFAVGIRPDLDEPVMNVALVLIDSWSPISPVREVVLTR